jgi:hypothetical protein
VAETRLSSYLTIISGGQTGVDRAALDWALHNKIPCKGWCPKGRLAESGPIPARYPLTETDSPELSIRTEYNVRDSQATLIIYHSIMDPGTLLTMQFCQQYKKNMMEVDLSRESNPREIVSWITEKKIETLNIAGPRESQSPGIYNAAIGLLNEIYNLIAAG